MKSGKCVYKKNPDGTKGELVGCTKGSIERYMSALHANVKENEVKCCKEFKMREILKQIKKGK